MAAPRSTPLPWPPKRSVLGVDVSATTWDAAVEVSIAAALEGASAVVALLPARTIVTSGRDPTWRERANRFELLLPDARLRWALRLLDRALPLDGFGGPELVLRLCERAAAEDVGVYLYGGTPDLVGRFRGNLRSRFPQLRVLGCEAAAAHALRKREDAALVSRVNRSGAGLVFLGLGEARDLEFAAAHRDRVRAVQVCASAAFDVYAGGR